MAYLNDDTICALATAHGGAMAIIRVSGNNAITITDALFVSPTGHQLVDARSHTAHYGTLREGDGEVIDDVVVTVMRAPRSYTGEDTAEISCHGSQYIITLILHALTRHGCRQALPGEFTQRAFLNGKLDLCQAEAVADLIASTNAATHKMALSQLRGNFTQRLRQLRDQLLNLTSLIELELDFSEHDVEFADRSQLLSLVEEIHHHIEKLVKSFKTGVAIRQGIPVAIIGKTNVGKSTLLNRLVHDDKAIVSDIHGTTRDVIEDVTQIHGLTFRFIDTAGIRNTADTIEQMGIERAYQKLDEAAIVIWLTDTSPEPAEVSDILTRTKGKRLIAVVNKIDKQESSYNPLENMGQGRVVPVIEISAKHDVNISQLEEEIFKAADVPEIQQNDVVVTNARHYEALSLALDDIIRVEDALNADLPTDLLSEDLRACIHHLAEIVGGEITTDETLQNIFSKFCVGK